VTLVNCMIELAHNLGMMVMADGVDSEEVWQLLGELSCDAAQGPFIVESGGAAAIAGWIGRHAPPAL